MRYGLQSSPPVLSISELSVFKLKLCDVQVAFKLATSTKYAVYLRNLNVHSHDASKRRGAQHCALTRVAALQRLTKREEKTTRKK